MLKNRPFTIATCSCTFSWFSPVTTVVSSGALYCLADISNHLVCGGGDEGLKLWKWDDLTRKTKVFKYISPPSCKIIVCL